MRAIAGWALTALLGAAGPATVAAEPATVVAETAVAPATGTLFDDALLARIRANTMLGVVELCRRLDAAQAGPVALPAAHAEALILGMPRRIQPFLSRIEDGRALDVVAAEVRPHPTLTGRRQLTIAFSDAWIADRATRRGRFGSASVKAHTAEIYLSRARTVVATIAAEPIRDPRAAAGGTPYAAVNRQTAIFSEDAIRTAQPGHPWMQAGQTAPIGLEDITGLAIAVRISGWWKKETDIQPVAHIFTYRDDPAGHIWLAYKELAGHVDRDQNRFQTTLATFDAGLAPEVAFPEYLALAPTADDVFSVIDLTTEGK